MTAPHEAGMLDLVELERLERAATQGPWQVEYSEIDLGPKGGPDTRLIAFIKGPNEEYIVVDEEVDASSDDLSVDAALIAAARNALPALIAGCRERDELRARIAEFEADFSPEDLHGWRPENTFAVLYKLAAAEARVRALEAQVAEVREALKPFATYSRATDPGEWADGEIAEQYRDGLRWSIKLEWLRSAARLVGGDAND